MNHDPVLRFLLAALLLAGPLACGSKKTPLIPDGAAGGQGGNPAGDGPAGGGGSGDGASGDGASPGGDCPSGEHRCGGACISTVADPRNCGGCGRACPGGQLCISSGCVTSCPMPLSPCAGTCVDTSSANEHCGGCGKACGAGTGCVTGSCKPGVVVGPPPARCVGGGPPIVLGDGGRMTCAGRMASATFKYGLCSCTDVGVPALSSTTLVDAYDSTLGPYKPGVIGGGVAANDGISMSSTFTVWGDVRSSAGAGLTVNGTTTIHRELQVGAGLNLNDTLTVTKDTYAGGALSANNTGTIGGTLFTPSCAAVPSRIAAASCVDAAVTVPPPCACRPDELVPVAGYVAFYKDPAHNDNAGIGLPPSVFARPGAPERLDLPCGYYYLDQIVAAGPITIGVHGKTAIIVGGSVIVSAALTFALDPGATLDLIVGGVVYASGTLTIGSPAYASRSRAYVGGRCGGEGAACSLDGECCGLSCDGGKCKPGGFPRPWAVNLTSGSQLAGLFYAAPAGFLTSSWLEIYGALFVGWFHSGSETRIHYDGAATKAAGECAPRIPPAPPDGGADGPQDGTPPCTPHDDDGDGYFACDCFTPRAGCAPTDPSPLCVADCCDAPGAPGCPSTVTTPAAAAAINPSVVERNCDGIDNNCGVEDARGAVTGYSCAGGASMCRMAPPPSCPSGVTPCGPGGIDPFACPSGTVCSNGCCINRIP